MNKNSMEIISIP